MAYDGLVVAATVKELRDHLTGGRIAKITQPEKDEIQLTIRNGKENTRIQISVNPSLPLLRETWDNKPSPLTAPSFCMALRKHLGNGLILNIRQPDRTLSRDGLERVVLFEIEHLDEMGDLVKRILSVELMGKHSNIILLREDFSIIDSIRRISASQSSIREVLPNRSYFIPDAGEKTDPVGITEDAFSALIAASSEPVGSTLSHRFTGISIQAASEICFRSKTDMDIASDMLNGEERHRLYDSFHSLIETIAVSGEPSPCILYEGTRPADFSAFLPRSYEADPRYHLVQDPSMSRIIETFYREKDVNSRIHQKSTDLRRILNTLLERTAKKLTIQEKQLKTTEDKDKYRVYGELLHTYGYSLQGGEDHLTCENFYTGKEITIPLQKDQTASQNAKRFLDKFAKLKRTEENVTLQLVETNRELAHLQSIQTALDLARVEEDLNDIRREMSDFGFIHKASVKDKKQTKKSRPETRTSSDGYEIYIGKNNYQNEEVTFRIADGGDLWFHAKNVPGSHVIVRTGGQPFETLPDRLFEEAAALAAYYSSHRADQKVDVDYTLRKNLRKVPNQAPGFVIYHQNWSITVEPRDLSDDKA